MSSFTLLGHQPQISIAELDAAVQGFEVAEKLDKISLLFSHTSPLPHIDTLGGVQLLAEEIRDGDTELSDIPQILENACSGIKGKITFGLRCMNLGKKDVAKLYRLCKQRLKDAGHPVRYVGNERKPAATALVLDSELTNPKKGCELVVIARESGLWVGKTVGVQNIHAYTKRDMDKPVRDMTVGILPPKLAQILLNFGKYLCHLERRREASQMTIFDPFCGTGVIPLECMLRGWNIVASDISQKAVNGCTKNIEWLRKEEKILKKDVSEEIFKHDATKAFPLKKEPDVIVTETTLGPNLTKPATKADAQKLSRENAELQKAFLENAKACFPSLPIVCTWPVWVTKSDVIHLPKMEQIVEQAGYTFVPVPGAHGDRPTLLYRRKDHLVAREIALLKPQDA